MKSQEEYSGVGYEDDYEIPSARGKTRRSRLINQMTDEQIRKKNGPRLHKSKPKGFKHNRKKAQKDY